MTTATNPTETALKVLLRDYGYEYRDGLLIEKAIPGWTSARVVGTYRSLFAAADSLNAICDSAYTDRWVKITM